MGAKDPSVTDTYTIHTYNNLCHVNGDTYHYMYQCLICDLRRSRCIYHDARGLGSHSSPRLGWNRPAQSQMREGPTSVGTAATRAESYVDSPG